MLRNDELSVTKLAEHIGYGSTSTFSVAYSRHVGVVGVAPSRYGRGGQATAE